MGLSSDSLILIYGYIASNFQITPYQFTGNYLAISGLLLSDFSLLA